MAPTALLPAILVASLVTTPLLAGEHDRRQDPDPRRTAVEVLAWRAEEQLSTPVNHDPEYLRALFNTDGAAELTSLTGIGHTTAAAIVEYRKANGSFGSVDELLYVKGIGAATLNKNRHRLSVMSR